MDDDEWELDGDSLADVEWYWIPVIGALEGVVEAIESITDDEWEVILTKIGHVAKTQVGATAHWIRSVIDRAAS